MSNYQTQHSYQKLSEKIFHLQNFELKGNRNRIEGIEHTLENVNNDMNKSMKDFKDKGEFISKEINALEANYITKRNIAESNQLRITNELKAAEDNLSALISSHKQQMQNTIDNSFAKIETDLNQIIHSRNGSKDELKRNLDELKRRVETDLPLLAKDIETVDTESKAKIHEISQMMKEEFAYVVNLVSI